MLFQAWELEWIWISFYIDFTVTCISALPKMEKRRTSKRRIPVVIPNTRQLFPNDSTSMNFEPLSHRCAREPGPQCRGSWCQRGWAPGCRGWWPACLSKPSGCPQSWGPGPLGWRTPQRTCCGEDSWVGYASAAIFLYVVVVDFAVWQVQWRWQKDRIHLPYNMTARMVRDTTAGTFLPEMIIPTLIRIITVQQW